MKKLAIGCGTCLLATSAFATVKGNEVTRLGDAANVLTELRAAPDAGIPENVWDPSAMCPGHSVDEKGRLRDWRRDRLRRHELSQRHRVERAGLHAPRQGKPRAADRRTASGPRAPRDEPRRSGQAAPEQVSLGADASLAAGPVGRSANAATDAQMK